MADTTCNRGKNASRGSVRFWRSPAGPAAIGLVLAVMLGAAADGAPSQETGPTNVVVILADDLGSGDLSCYGATDLATPAIDSLAARGMKWNRFYANSCVCSPTRAAILTGRYPDAVGVPGVIRTHAGDSWGYLAAWPELLPAALQPAGYHTAMVGKWHLGLGGMNLPNWRGFDHFEGFLGDMMDDYLLHRRHEVNYLRRNAEPIDPQGHATDLFSEWACRYLQQAEEPFFLYLAYNAPHDPIQPPADQLARYRAQHPQVDPERTKIAALIEHLDAGIGRVLETLEKRGLAGKTLVLFTSDNGGALRFRASNGSLRAGKGTLYEGGIRVPLLARWPGHIAPGSACDAVGLAMDIYPTVMQAAGLTPPGDLPSVSLLPVLAGQAKETPPRDLFWGWRDRPGIIRAVRRGPYKLLEPAPGKPAELYDVESDPGETANLAASKPDVVQQLQDALQAHGNREGSAPYRPYGGIGPGEIDPAEAGTR